MKSTPWLSVVIPTYNGAAYLGRALDSVVAQGDPSVEVVAVDDGSDDSTLAVLRAYASRLPLTAVPCGRVGNWVAAANLGLSLARGEYACILHQDDLWSDDRLRILKSRVLSSPETSLWLHPCQFIDRSGKWVGMWRCPLPEIDSGIEPSFLIRRLLVQNFIGMPAPLFRRTLADRVGGLDDGLWYTADWDFWLKMAAVGGARYTPQPLAMFRIHPSSQTARRGPSEGIRAQLETVLDRHLPPWAAGNPGGEALERIARASIDLNVWLAARAGGSHQGSLPILRTVAGLGPCDGIRLLRYSRIFERVAARLRAGVGCVENF